MNVNLEQKQKYEKWVIEPDTYIGTIVEISDIKTEKGFPQKNKDGTVESKMVDKFRIEVELDYLINNRKVKLPYFLNATVSHASKSDGYSDSKLYTLLEQANELEAFKGMWAVLTDKSKEEQNKWFIDWLRAKLLSRKIKIMPKTVKSSFDGSPYSIIGQVIKFEN